MHGFKLAYDHFDPAEEGLREALTSTGNGYFCTRGAAEWEEADGLHYPGTYAHDVYNRETTIMGGRPVPNEDLVALPNWLVLALRIDGDEPIRLENVELLSYRHELDVRCAIVLRELRVRDRAGAGEHVAQPPLRQHGPHAPGGHRLALTPHNWSGRVDVISALDGRVMNRGVARYRQLEGRHLDGGGARTFGPT